MPRRHRYQSRKRGALDMVGDVGLGVMQSLLNPGCEGLLAGNEIREVPSSI